MISPSGRCESCHGKVHNAGGRRKTLAQLEEIHRVSCPGRGRILKEEPDVDDQLDGDEPSS